MKLERTARRPPEGEPRAFGQDGIVAAKLERRSEVVREHLRVVLGPARAPRSSRRRGGARPARSARGICAVGDVADQHVAEGVLGLARRPRVRRSRRTKSLRSSAWSSSLDRPRGRCRRASRARRPRTPCRARRRPAAAPSPPGASPSRRAAMMPWTVSGRAARRLAALLEHPGVLLRVQRVAARPRERASACVVGRRAAAARAARRSGARCRRRTSGESASVSAFDLPPPQAGRRSSSSGRAVADDEERDTARPVDEVVDEVEQVRRPPSAGPRRRAPAAAARRAPRRTAARRRTPRARRSAPLNVVAEADERPQVADDPVADPRPTSRGDRVVAASASTSARRVALQDARPRP